MQHDRANGDTAPRNTTPAWERNHIANLQGFLSRYVLRTGADYEEEHILSPRNFLLWYAFRKRLRIQGLPLANLFSTTPNTRSAPSERSQSSLVALCSVPQERPSNFDMTITRHLSLTFLIERKEANWKSLLCFALADSTVLESYPGFGIRSGHRSCCTRDTGWHAQRLGDGRGVA
jgi:hypothetical protein